MDRNEQSRFCVFVGGGKMGEAMLSGWLSQGDFTADHTTIVEPGSDRCAYLTATYGVTCVAHVSEVKAADLVILAVKPQVMDSVLQDVVRVEAFSSALFISVAAGLSTDTIGKGLPQDARLVRVMPNLPLVVSEGASAICESTTSREDDIALVLSLFGKLGKALVVEESKMDAVTALSGSGPAYVAAMIEALTQAGIEQGLPEDVAYSLSMQTVYGTALQLKETGESATALREAVSSPGGTTLAALDAMRSAGMQDVYKKGVVAAVQRSKELAQCNQ